MLAFQRSVMRVMCLVRNGFVFAILVLGLLLLGCAQQSPQPTATPTATPSVAPTPVPTAVPSASVEPTASPEPSAPPASASKEQAVENYLNAVKEKNYEKAYALVSSDFKKEDPEAGTVESFKTAVERDLPEGFSFSGVRATGDNAREVLVTVTKPGTTMKLNYGFVVLEEKGGWMLRVPFASEGKYYNGKTAFRYTSPELSRFFERALNDYFSTFDSTLNSSPVSMSLFDAQSRTYFASKKLRLKLPGFEKDGRESYFEAVFGPSDMVSSWNTISTLQDGRDYSFKFSASASTGGDGAFGCYSSSSYSGGAKYLLSFKMDLKMAEFMLNYSSEPNPFKTVFNHLSKACPN